MQKLNGPIDILPAFPGCAIFSDSCNQKQKHLELYEQLTIVEQLRESGIADIPAKSTSAKLRSALRG